MMNPNERDDLFEFEYNIRYDSQTIKTFDNRLDAIEYVDDFFSGVDDDRQHNSIHIYVGQYTKIYSTYRNLAYKAGE